MKKLTALALIAILSLTCVSALAQQKITIGATPLPHALILEFIKEDFEALGYSLDIQVGSDYFVFNPATAERDTDANYFQHQPFLTSSYNNEAPADKQLVAVFGVHYEPLGLFPGKVKSLEEVKEGSEIVIPNDPSNQTRALLLLQQVGWITLPENAFENGASIDNIVENKHNLKITEVAADLLPSAIADADFGVINGNYAIAAGFASAAEALAAEAADSDAGKIYTNIVAVRAEDKDAQWVKDLQSVLQTEKVKEYIQNEVEFAGAVKPSF
ncbi:MAG: MetQ/NlpA family ABC transporter substrate-binding protein [Eubacteriales bacterium]|nr:MetQ/NlpA family ABC transporter substrate-binding protein [Eubacteriales bacterium]